ncbi:MAG: DNA-directed RNA polymerase subunit H [Candidatus Thorarchaeota archaeon]|nr:DNA-directed RNA polymerase subunit H [Candidatus Thorarchaeota archaeon]
MVEIPSIIVKTRTLLSLRGYTLDEYLEFDDRYEMVPEKREGEEVSKLVVWIFKEPRVVGVATVKDVARGMEEAGAAEGMMVGGSRFTPAAKKQAKAMKVELVEGNYSSFDLFDHELVPKHVIASEDEVKMVLDHYGIKRPHLPRIMRDDPAAKLLGARPGQVLRIERKSKTAGVAYYYRLVVDGAR